MLVEHGALAGYLYTAVPLLNVTPLNALFLYNKQANRDTKLDICCILLEHAKDHAANAVFLHHSFQFATKQTATNDASSQFSSKLDWKQLPTCRIVQSEPLILQCVECW